MKGRVTAIQSACYDDGPGLRTTVFLKGCPLRCFWCHNPESLTAAPQLAWYSALCISCGVCVSVCPTGARTGSGLQIDRTQCIQCGRCADNCPPRALEQIGTLWEAEALSAHLAQDLPYFQATGGGVTISGGEPLLQWEFTRALLQALQRRGIHTAIETSGYASAGIFDSVTQSADLVIMDLKHPDSTAHRAATGVGNQQILENFHRLCAAQTPCILRTPVIPGVNDTPEIIARIAQLAAQAKGLVYYELLPYHALGTGKLESLGRSNNSAPALVPPSAEQMHRLRQAARSAKIPVK